MSLATLLTPKRLQSLAGYGYDRGERYAQQGHVLSCELDGDTLEGTVAGSEIYRVRVMAHGQQLVTDCTCPIGLRGGMCKHAVALVLHHLAAGSAPTQKIEPPTGFQTRDELERWARDHEVTHELGVSADAIIGELTSLAPSLAYMLGRWTLGELGSVAGARQFLQGWTVQREVIEVVRRRLDAAAASVLDAIAAEAAPAGPLADAAFAGLRDRLVALRRELRRSAPPRSLDRTPGTLTFDPVAIALVWSEPVRVSRGTAMFAFAPVSARLTFASRVELTCSCKAAACTHGVALVDSVLAFLADPARVDEARRIVDEVERPPWRRALAALSAGEAVAKPAAEIELWWYVETELGALTVTPVVKRRLKKGTFSAGTRVAPGRLLDEHGTTLADQDQRVAEHLVAWTRSQRNTYPMRAFAALVGHPRVATDAGEPIAVRRLPLGFTAIEAGGHIRLEPSVDSARFSPRLLAPLLETFAIGEPLVVLEPEHARCLLIDVGEEARKLWGVLAKHGDTFPPEAHGELLDRLAMLDRKLPIAVPSALMGDRLDEPPVTVLRLHLVGDGLEADAFVRAAAGAPLYPPGAGPRDIMLLRDGRRGYVRRNLAAELPALRAALSLLALDGVEEGPPLSFRITDTEQALALVARLQDPPPGVEAEWVDAARMRVVGGSSASSLRVQIDRKRDWFGVTGELKVEAGRIELATMLDAVRRQRRFVRIDAERWVELDAALRERLAGLADRTFEGRGEGALELSPAAAGEVRAIRDAGARVEAVPAWELITDKLLAATKLRPRPSQALHATLRPYQIEGHAWLARLAAWGVGGCLADDMGLGKTVQAIAMLLDRAKLGPAIVLAPTSVSLNWVDELRRFAPSLRPVVYGAEPDRVACLASLGKKDVLIVSYGLLARDAERLANITFATLVVDEAQLVKNQQTTRARAARALQAEFRVAMSGTPFENHLGELWSLFAIVFPGLLGSWEQFRVRFAVPIERDRDPQARAALSRVIRPFLLRRTKAEVAPELPARSEIEVPVALSSEEYEMYEDARLAALMALSKEGKQQLRDEQRRFQVLAALTRLRLLASHPRLYNPTSPVASSKLQRLLELVDELRSEGHRALVFSQFTSHLALVRAELERAGLRLLYLDGATPTATRADLIRRFQAGEADVFLISLKAGGTGINLTAADYVIHLDPWWNPAVEDQATDRAHRIGQTKPVTVYRLISRGTVEEKILALHATKRELVAGVLAGSDVAGKLSTRDLLELLSDPA